MRKNDGTRPVPILDPLATGPIDISLRTHRLSPWTVALSIAALTLLALNLRTAVSSLSPVVTHIRTELDLPSVLVGVIGMLPPLCFALAGVLAPLIARYLSLETTILLGLVLITAGSVLRAAAPASWAIIVGTAVALFAMGVANVLLPAIVKDRFPDHVGLISAVYVTLLAVSAFLPPLIAVPLADGPGWRISLGVWAALALVAVLPWLGLLPSRSRPRRIRRGHRVGRAPWRSRTAWAITGLFTLSSLNSYAVYAWLPQILVELKGLDPTSASLQLSLFAALGIPLGLLTPLVATRRGFVRPAAFLAIASLLVGYPLLVFGPVELVPVAVCTFGLVQLLFSLGLTLVGMRSASAEEAASLSGFMQGVGYLVAASGPLLLGVLNAATDSWLPGLVFLTCTAFLAIPAAILIDRPDPEPAD
ncbi:CP family cyanate transporter-like MFS transporter [Pseudoclavibacter chungangensis]|uniref:MFS transporter n=1 Tax=Pseudoclavibacter chungangensis TaxID=587635 RepID=UPI0015CEBF5F|nr:MFS transporter [Pseudoclavibacter chungangensis]NYJ68702.1 CP family cyanate transporter-like MFS transporter [Pseudoclavibacter chungangensis]